MISLLNNLYKTLLGWKVLNVNHAILSDMCIYLNNNMFVHIYSIVQKLSIPFFLLSFISNKVAE